MSYSVILPTLNEAGHIVKLVGDIIKYLSKSNYEILIIDDDSSDSTPELCLKLERKYQNVSFFSRKGKKKKSC